MQTITVKDMVIGEGIPKVIVSLMGERVDELLEQAQRGREAGVDCFEYRADFAADPFDFPALASTAHAIAEALPQNPVLFTLRTKGQGGKVELSASELEQLYSTVIADGTVDAIDIESWLGDDVVRKLCMAAHEAHMATVVSFHDFGGTPDEEEMVRLLLHFDDLGADIPKIAVMANSAADVIAVLAATERVNRTNTTGPLHTMAMGPQGSITRLTGEAFGSALTFCALDRASAPGQVGVTQARDIMEQLHEIASRS